MRPDEARKLLGGYATGTLTRGEQEALFAAALEDQELFDALAREQALRDAMDDPEVRAELLDAVTGRRTRRWFAWWPVPVGAAGLALAGLTVLVMMRSDRDAKVTVADNRPPVAMSSPPPVGTGSNTAPREPEPRRKLDAVSQTKAPVQAEGPAPEKLTVREEAPPKPQEKVVLDAPAPESLRAAAPVAALESSNAPAAAPAPPPAIKKESLTFVSAAQRMFESGITPASEGRALALRPRGAVMGARPGAVANKAADAAMTAEQPVWPGPGLKYSLSPGGAISAESNIAGVLQVFRKTESGEWVAVGGATVVKARTPLTVDAGAGEVLLVLSARALPALAPANPKLSLEVESMKARAGQAMTGASGETHFAVEPDTRPEAVLVVVVPGRK